MSDRPSDEYYASLERRLRALLPLVETVVPRDVGHWFNEYLDAGEYGLAVETVAEALPDDPSGEAVGALASRLIAEADVMGLAGPISDRLRRLANKGS
ncbi:MAG TPA: hypothetical protein VGW10_18750 [Solirubrobacteraceae bacterium]|nr:hypothetical protein [Solirubrobacteraceae bacterium]